MVKGHPAYSGTIMTATFQIVRELGWGYLREARDPADHAGAVVDRSAEEARARRARRDGRRQRLQPDPAQGRGPAGRADLSDRGHADHHRADRVFKSAPNPNAARLFQNWLHSREGQQLLVDFAGQHSVHAQVKDKAGHKKLSEIKLMKDDPAGVEKMADEIKARYQQVVQGVMKPVSFPAASCPAKAGIQ